MQGCYSDSVRDVWLRQPQVRGCWWFVTASSMASALNYVGMRRAHSNREALEERRVILWRCEATYRRKTTRHYYCCSAF